MSRSRFAAVAALAVLFALPVASEAQCDDSGTGDICASGSAWYEFTRLSVEPRNGSMPATTLTVHDGNDFSVVFPRRRARREHGRLIVIDGRVMLMRDVAHEPGYETDVLDGSVLIAQLVVSLLDQAFPAGPSSVLESHPVEVRQKSRAIRVATPSASARFDAPWVLTGTVRRRAERVEYDLRFSARTPEGPYSFKARGFWQKEPKPPSLDERMPLDGWTVHWLGPMTTTSADGTTRDHAAQPASSDWKSVADLRTWISEEPARRADRRTPVDASNPGRLQAISFEAFVTDKHGPARSLGTATREYRPGTDVLAEDTEHDATRKTLSLGLGLSLSTDVYREPSVTGFGLVLVKDGTPCFSWEWFDKDSGDVFTKLQGGGKATVTIVDSSGFQELGAVEFLDDVVLGCRDKSTGTVYEARITKGSVLRLRP